MTHLDPSRRDFLATSTAGLIGLALRSDLVSTRHTPPQNHALYVGTYTENGRADGIHILRMDPATGALRIQASIEAGANPSFLALHPNHRVLYAVNEVTEHNGKPSGAVSAFAIAAETGALTRINEQPSEGGAPCYVSVDRSGRAVFVANYVGGNVALLPLHTTGALLPATRIVQHAGTGPNAERQEAAHAHFIAPDPSNRFLLAADLGVDRVMVYRLRLDQETFQHMEGAAAVMSPGAGPRHLVFHPAAPLVFVANELDSTVTTLRFDHESGALSRVASTSTLPTGWNGANYPADIHLSAAGRTLYVSNRGHNSVAVFDVAESTGALTPVQHISTAGDWPRNFTLDPSGRWLLVANQRSNSIVVFARDQESGRLNATDQRLDVASPVCLLFHKRAGA